MSPSLSPEIATVQPAVVAEEPESVHIEPEPEPVAIEPEPEPEPVAIEPEPEPEPVAVEPEVTAEEPVVVDLEPEAVEPEIVVEDSEPVGTEPEREPVAVEPEVTAVEPAVTAEEPAVIEPEPVAVEPEVTAVEPAVTAEEPAVIEPEPVAVEPEPDVREPEDEFSDEDPVEGLAAPVGVAERLAPEEPAIEGLGPGAALGAKTVANEPIALQSRLLSVPEKRVSWLAPAIRRLASQRDAKLAAELVIELIPAQRELIETPLSYEIKIGELGTFYVTLEPGQATISREPRGSVDFSLEGPVAAFSELAAGGAGRRYPGLRIRKGKRRARRFLKSRRRPVALADLAAVGVDVWPGLLLLAMAEAIDASWTTGRRFELAFEIQDAPGVVIYVRACDGEPIRVSRTAVGAPVATISLSGHALTCLLAGTQPPAEDRTLVKGDITSVDMFLQWTARAQGLVLADA